MVNDELTINEGKRSDERPECGLWSFAFVLRMTLIALASQYDLLTDLLIS